MAALFADAARAAGKGEEGAALDAERALKPPVTVAVVARIDLGHPLVPAHEHWAAVGGAIFLLLAVRLARSHAGEAGGQRNDDGLYDVRAGAKDARNLFAFSILYLTLLFATLLAEHLMGLPALELL